MGADKYICYADDSYVVTTGRDLDEVLQRVKVISQKHADELRSLGRKVNESKSEVVVFTR